MENERKILVVYYSRTGVTAKIAGEVAKALNADLEEIKDSVDRKGALGYLRCSIDSALRKSTPIHEVEKKPEDYDLVVVGTPVWGSTMCSPVRTYLNQYRDSIRNAVFLMTFKLFGTDNVIRNMEMVLGKKPLSVIQFKTGHTSRSMLENQIKELASLPL